MTAALIRPLPPVAPQEAGFAPDLAARFGAGIRSGLLHSLHAVVVVRAGRLVLEHYEEAADECWGRPLGRVSFGPDVLHDLRSVTKSVVSLLYGIALARGLVPPPDAPLLAAFPDYGDLAADPARAAWTVRHALTMTLGIEWDEERPYTDPLNSEIAMELADDRFRFVLSRPIVDAPGARWVYCGGASALIGALIARGTGRSLPDFAREVLFEPAGLGAFEWSCGTDGTPSAASGLRLTPHGLARLGALLAGGGSLAGRQIVPADWLAASFRPAVSTGDGLDYGLQWWLGEGPVGPDPGPGVARPGERWAAGFGNGGQRLFLLPSRELAVTIFSSRYNAFDAWITPTRIWREIVLANLLA
ncbi:serine hydrolase domain-containing protein [Segnochrobactrum spirostomi]|uniref:Serine hydrolase n=1 Tax=Segnochrobactrum spirostomi TaxID=2608987 RepID=A0A6A7Y0J0_9HYPH|nr:serine hydrolase [Segnochrobactrum spirostomi]MQT12126.1 serine hydrolase [Segnochrobactrum spirostomi]